MVPRRGRERRYRLEVSEPRNGHLELRPLDEVGTITGSVTIYGGDYVADPQGTPATVYASPRSAPRGPVHGAPCRYQRSPAGARPTTRRWPPCTQRRW